MLTLTEELLLLSLREKKDGLEFAPETELPYALAGALLLELCLGGRVRLEGKKVAPVNPTPTGSAMADELLEKIAAAKKPKKAAAWIESFGEHGKRIRKAAACSLVAQGILREEEKRFLWVIPYTGYAAVDTSAKFTLKQRLRGLALGGENANPHDLALLSLVRAGGLLDNVFTKDEMRRAKRRVEELVKDEAVGQAVAEAIQAVNTAVIVAATTALGS